MRIKTGFTAEAINTMNTDQKWGNQWCYDNDSSNHAHDGANGHEGVPEMIQRLAKEKKNFGPSPILKVLPEVAAAHIAKKLLQGEI